MDSKRMILTAVMAAVEAGHAILRVYHSDSDFKVEEKADSSPLTIADMRSHEIIINRLSDFQIPILSEEGKNIPYLERKNWDTFWLVDPLDGTKEFIKKNGEFTVNIAMICQGQPVAGVIHVPDKSVLYFGSNEIGSYKVDISHLNGLMNNRSEKGGRLFELSDGEANKILEDLIDRAIKLPVHYSEKRAYTVAGSRSHATPELEAFVKEKRQEYEDVEFISAGSSLKLCLVAEGRADVYPRTGPTMEWDTAAGQAIVENSGGRVIHFDSGEPLVYNKENLLNPWFIVLR